MNTAEVRPRPIPEHHRNPGPVRADQAKPASANRGPRRRWYVILAVVAVIAGLGAGGWLSSDWWLPKVHQMVAAIQEHVDRGQPGQDAAGAHGQDDAHGQPDPGSDEPAGHDHAGQAAAGCLQLSDQARKNIGLTLATVEPRDFERTMTVPARMVGRPGRTEIEVSAPMTGIVSRIYPVRGEAVTPGQHLFEIRLTHEDLVEKQSGLLRFLEELDVVRREVARLEKVTASGAVAGKRLLERQYEQQKIEAAIRAERQALVLHGLSEEQIDALVDSRKLLRQLSIAAPPPANGHPDGTGKVLLEVSELAVKAGQHVSAGQRLCTLKDHAELYVEGKAFEQDAAVLNRVAAEGRAVTLAMEDNGNARQELGDLRIFYVENEVEVDSRALLFYVKLPNQVVRDEETSPGHRFVGWRFKPGQRAELLVPVQRWENCIVLPIAGLVREGVEWFVYRQNGNHFDRQPVHLAYRDQRQAVIENDGTLFPGDVVAASGAYQIHLAIKNKASGVVDPHAGHNH